MTSVGCVASAVKLAQLAAFHSHVRLDEYQLVRLASGAMNTRPSRSELRGLFDNELLISFLGRSIHRPMVLRNTGCVGAADNLARLRAGPWRTITRCGMDRHWCALKEKALAEELI